MFEHEVFHVHCKYLESSSGNCFKSDLHGNFEISSSRDTKPITKVFLHCLVARAYLFLFMNFFSDYFVVQTNFGNTKKLLSDQGTKMGLKYLLTEIAIPQFMTRGVNYSKQFQSICF